MTTTLTPQAPVPAPVAVRVGDASRQRARITPNLFAISLGLAGLAQTWTGAGQLVAGSEAVADGLWVVTALVWMITGALYVRAVRAHGGLRAELTDPVFGPFVAVPAIVAVLLAGALYRYLPPAGVAVFVVAVVAVLVVGAVLLAVWMLHPTPEVRWHPGYFLPSVGGPFVAATVAAHMGEGAVGLALFGLGAVSWMLLGAVLLQHLTGRGLPPAPLLPTMAILVAPPALAGNAWFALGDGRVDAVALALAGYAAAMALLQVALLPAYRRAPFGPGWWSFTFPFSALTADAINWFTAIRLPQTPVWTVLVLAGLTAFIAFVLARTAFALARHTFLPRPAGR